MQITEILSWIGTATGIVVSVPQIIKSYRTKDVEDVSALTYILLLITGVCYFFRSIFIHEIPFVFYYSFVILTSLVQLALIYKYRPKKVKSFKEA